jgi:hypothetical protein
MQKTYSGGCACGAIRYEISGEPVAMLHCQCRQCQRDSGTGHQSHVTFVEAQMTSVGDVSHWQSTGDGGTVKRRGFCSTCGSPIFLTFPAMPEVLIVTPASLDDPGVFKPAAVTWTSAGEVWDHLDPTIAKFETMPS